MQPFRGRYSWVLGWGCWEISGAVILAVSVDAVATHPYAATSAGQHALIGALGIRFPFDQGGFDHMPTCLLPSVWCVLPKVSRFIRAKEGFHNQDCVGRSLFGQYIRDSLPQMSSPTAKQSQMSRITRGFMVSGFCV